MLDFATPISNQDLEVLDGSGQTLLHYAVFKQKEGFIKQILDCRPDLLYRENSVGRTPFELAEDAYIADRVSKEPSALRTYPSWRHILSNLHQPPGKFVPEKDMERKVDAESIWLLCRKYMAKNPGKRMLVSLMDANEVARRLA